MLESVFRDNEKALIMRFRDQWEGLKGSSKQRDEFGNLMNAKDDLIDTIVQDFFETFPERDVTRSPGHKLAFNQSDRDKLHTRIRQLFYNKTHRDNKQDKTNLKVKNPMKKVSLEILFKQRYNERIISRRDSFKESTDPTKRLRAYNLAVKLELEDFQINDPNEHEHLQEVVDSMRLSNKQDFDGQTEDLQEAILDLLPAEMVSTVRDWEHRTGAAVYVISMWHRPDGKRILFDYASKKCGRFANSALASRITKDWSTWMSTNQGFNAPRSVENAEPNVYPDSQGMPMLPDLHSIKMKIGDQKRLVRRYIITKSLAAGGEAPRWGRMEQDMIARPGQVVDIARMPDKLHAITDMKNWTRPTLDLWIKHILRGQNDEAYVARRFQFREVPAAAGHVPRIALRYESNKHHNSKLVYTPLEELYGRRVLQEQTDSSNKEQVEL
ncbi:hypothetical protein BDV93DRAFT_560280 [Ceratobasidium sp. AG-I]|nr:hypothetical protein BDV93DRAFT_560280 [Ceratobasidium sp. AG-I]